jgi:hypothetical protein
MSGQLTAGVAIDATALPQPVLWWALAVVTAFRLAWVVLYLFIARSKSPLKIMTSGFYSKAADQNSDAGKKRQKEIHESVAAKTDRMADTCLIVGALALAAWTALFAVADQAPGSQLSSTSRSLLLVGAAALIAAPVIFRVPNVHTTYIGRRSAQFIGFTAVGLAFVSLANDLLGGIPRLVITTGGILVLVLRDICDSIAEIRFQHQLIENYTPA